MFSDYPKARWGPANRTSPQLYSTVEGAPGSSRRRCSRPSEGILCKYGNASRRRSRALTVTVSQRRPGLALISRCQHRANQFSAKWAQKGRGWRSSTFLTENSFKMKSPRSRAQKASEPQEHRWRRWQGTGTTEVSSD